MLITKGGISREIDGKDLQVYKDKGYAVKLTGIRLIDVTASPAEKPLDRLNKAELEAKALELGIEIPEGATKKIIIELIQAKPDDAPIVEPVDSSGEILEEMQEGGE